MASVSSWLIWLTTGYMASVSSRLIRLTTGYMASVSSWLIRLTTGYIAIIIMKMNKVNQCKENQGIYKIREQPKKVMPPKIGIQARGSNQQINFF